MNGILSYIKLTLNLPTPLFIMSWEDFYVFKSCQEVNIYRSLILLGIIYYQTLLHWNTVTKNINI